MPKGITILELVVALGIFAFIISMVVNGYVVNSRARDLTYSKLGILEVESHVTTNLFRSISKTVADSDNCRAVFQKVNDLKFWQNVSENSDINFRVISSFGERSFFLEKKLNCQRNSTHEAGSRSGVYMCVELLPEKSASAFLNRNHVYAEFLFAFWDTKNNRSIKCDEFLKLKDSYQAAHLYYSLHWFSKARNSESMREKSNSHPGIFYGQIIRKR